MTVDELLPLETDTEPAAADGHKRSRRRGRVTRVWVWVRGRLLAPTWRFVRRVWRWTNRGPAGSPQPAVWRARRLAAPRQAAAWALLLAGLCVSVWAAMEAHRKDRPPAYVEADRGAAAADWAAVNWREAGSLGRTPWPIGVTNEGGGYYRVVLDRGSRAGCVELGVIDRPGGFRLAGDLPAPVACPPVQAAAAVTGDDLVGDLRVFVVRFTADYLGGGPLDLYAAPGVTLEAPAPASTYRVESIKARTYGDGRSAPTTDVTVTVTADQGDGPTRLAFRVLVKDRSGKPEVVDVKGGAFVTDLTPRTVLTPPVTVGQASNPGPTTSTTARPATTPTTTSSSPPPVTVAPGATTVPSSAPPPPANAGA